MIDLKVEGYCHQCLDFVPDVTPPVRSVDDDGNRTQSDTIIQCKHKNRCAGIKRYLEQQAKGEANG